MLLTKEQIGTLKKNQNVSKNADKTKERVATDFRAATKEQKRAIMELSGQADNSIFRVYNVGSINARILLALSQTLNVQPWYYTGEIEERQELDEGQIAQFLKVHGYDELAKELGRPASKRKNDKSEKKPLRAKKIADDVEPAADATVVEEPVQQEQTVVEPPCTCESGSPVKEVKLVLSDDAVMNKAVEELTEQEAVELLHTLFIRAKGGGEAAELADLVKRVLLK